MRKYNVAVIAGDGIGPEVTAEARKVADAAARRFGFAIEWADFPFGAEYYLAHGETLPKTALAELAGFDALLLGAIGDPKVPPGPLEQGILLKLRFHFDQYMNLRAAKSYAGAPSAGPMDAVVVRENTEDLYMGLGGRGVGSLSARLELERRLYSLAGAVDLAITAETEAAFSIGVMTRPGIERIARQAFALARRRGESRVEVVSKANAVPHLYGFWDETTRAVARAEFPELEYVSVNVDAMCYLACREPSKRRVVLCPNLFGDIVSDLLSGLAGGLGLAASGNMGDGLSMFEPVHGSAPGIAGTGKANPLAAILSGAMLLDHLGETGAGTAVERAVSAYLAEAGEDDRPVELGGKAATVRVGEAVARKMGEA